MNNKPQFKALRAVCLVRKAERKAIASGRLDINLSELIVLYLISTLPPSAGLLKLHAECKKVGRSMSTDQLRTKIDVLRERNYVGGVRWRNVEILPGGLNLLVTFNTLLRSERVNKP